MKPAIVLPPEPNERWDLARQMGVEHAVTWLPSTEGNEDPWEFDPMLRTQQRFADAGFELAVIEGRPPMDEIKTGGPDRGEQIETVRTFLENMGRVGIPVWCSSWMAKLGWQRTSTRVPDRGGSFVTAYDHDLLRDAPPAGDVAEETLWANLEDFLERVGPVAEDADVKMAMHPDDPPLSPLRGVGRIMRSVDAYERLLESYSSEHNGICLCQGNFAAMGADIPSVIRRFGDRIHFVHFRDVRGTTETFRETWHDDGPTDMLACMRAYHDVGFEGVMRPDHVPTMAGEDNDHPGYEMKGRLFAVGYMRGLIEAVEDEGG